MTNMETAEMPDISHLRMADFDKIYEPAEDTFLFLDALLSERACLRELHPTVCMEIGCGSGVMITYLSKMLEEDNIFTLSIGTDINSHATSALKGTGKLNNVRNLEVYNTNLWAGLLPRITRSVDVLLFNPPYVPTPSEEVGGTDISAAWAGGVNGREVIDRVLPKLNSLLSDRGVLYMVLVRENRPKQIASLLLEQGFKMETVASKRAKNEALSIVKVTRQQAQQQQE